MKHLFVKNSRYWFKFDTHSYSSRNVKTRCVGPNDKITLFPWRYFIFINLKLLISNLSITFWNFYSLVILKFLEISTLSQESIFMVLGWIEIRFFRRFAEQRQWLFKNVRRLSFPSITFVDIDKIETWKI